MNLDIECQERFTSNVFFFFSARTVKEKKKDLIITIQTSNFHKIPRFHLVSSSFIRIQKEIDQKLALKCWEFIGRTF
jgi:hypothetical protein